MTYEKLSEQQKFRITMDRAMQFEKESKNLRAEIAELLANADADAFTISNLNAKIVELEEEKKKLEEDNEFWKESFDREALIVQELEDENCDLEMKNRELLNQVEMRQANDLESNEYWNGVFDDDYPFNKENVYKELADYYFILNQLPTIYMEITGGTLSKTNYFASSILNARADSFDRINNEKYGVEDRLHEAKEKLKKVEQERDLYKIWYRAKHDDLKNHLGELTRENSELKKKFNIDEQECWDIALLKSDLAKVEEKLSKIKGYCIPQLMFTECSQLLNSRGKCTGDCMADYKEEFRKIMEE